VKYIQEGGVKLAVVNAAGKEAVVAILGPGDFFGEGCLAGQPVCMATAVAIEPTSILFIEKKEMMRVLHEEHALSDVFISHMLARNIPSRKISSISCSTPARNAWLELFSCWPVTARKTSPTDCPPQYRKRCLRR